MASRSEQIMQDVEFLYFVKALSIRAICKHLKTSNHTVSLCIETIINKRTYESDKTFPDLTDEQILKQNLFIEKLLSDRNKYAYKH